MPESDINIRWADLSDAGPIAEVKVRSWQSAYKGLIAADYLGSMSVAEHTERWAKNLVGETTRTLVLEKGGRVVGFARLGAARGAEFVGRRVGEIYAFYLLEEYWGRGLGRALMTRALQELDKEGSEAVIVWALEGNRRAQEFYLRIGFVPDGATQVEDRGEFELHEVRYAKRLSPITRFP